jgi:integrase
MKFYLHHYTSKAGNRVMIEYHNAKIGGRFVYSTRFSVSSTFWDKKRQIAKKPYDYINEELSTLEEKIEEYMRSLNNPTALGLRAHLDGITAKPERVDDPEPENLNTKPLLWLYKDHYLLIMKAKITHDTYRAYLQSYTNGINPFLVSQGKSGIRCAHFTHSLYQSYEGYLRERYSPNSVAKMIKHFAMFMNFVQKDDVKFGVKRDDIKFREEPGLKISLSEEQLRIIKARDFKSDFLNRIRDVMLIQCSTGLRISDLFRFAKNSNNNRLTIVQKKTGKIITMPLTKTAKEIIKRYKGEPPKFTEQRYRKGIKEVYRKIDKHGMIQIKDYKTGKFKDVFIHKEISSHDLVRTFITLSAAKGVPVPHIAVIVGKTEDVIYRHYLNVSQSDAEKEYVKAWDI